VTLNTPLGILHHDHTKTRINLYIKFEVSNFNLSKYRIGAPKFNKYGLTQVTQTDVPGRHAALRP